MKFSNAVSEYRTPFRSNRKGMFLAAIGAELATTTVSLIKKSFRIR